MDDMTSFYSMLAFLAFSLLGGYIAIIIFLKIKPGKSTEAQIARRALRSLGIERQASWKTVIVSASRDVEVPLEKLWETWTRLEDWPAWSAMHASTRWDGEPEWQVGARFEQALKLGFPFGHIRSVETVAQYSPEREVGWCKNIGPVKSCHIWSFSLLPNRRVRVTSTEVFHGTLVGIFKPFIVLKWPRLFERSITNLAHKAEKASTTN